MFALVVGDGVSRVLPDDAPFTSDPQLLMNAVSRHLGHSGRTIWDGVQAGLGISSAARMHDGHWS
ncbi:MAG: hypothetical protein U0Q11_24390 [Vicinamibacterales bacterium]